MSTVAGNCPELPNLLEIRPPDVYFTTNVGDRHQTLNRLAATTSRAVLRAPVMSGNPPLASPGRPPGNKAPTRDKHGRWVRRGDDAGGTPAQDFVFDDRIFEGAPPPAEEDLLHSADSEFLVEDVFGSAAATRRKRPVPGRSVSRPLLLFGALLLGGVFFAVQRGYFTAGEADPATPRPPPSIVAPVVIPTVPKPTIRRPVGRPAAPQPIDDDREAARAVATPATVPAPERLTPTLQAPAATEAEPAAPMVDEESWFNIAEEYLQLGDEKSAEELYRRILDEGAQRGRAALALGDLFAGRNDFARAQKYYRVSKQHFQGSDRPVPPP